MPIIQLVAFRGAGGVINRNSPYFEREPGLIRAGHVGMLGILDDEPETIIGFSPTSDAAEVLGGEQALLDKLVKEHDVQPGCLQDDTAVFERAYELIDETRGRTTVWMLDVEISDDARREIQSWYTKQYTAQYNLPEEEPPEFQNDQYNCATFPSKFNVPIPAMTGKLQQYIKHMIEKGAIEWTPKNRNP